MSPLTYLDSAQPPICFVAVDQPLVTALHAEGRKQRDLAQRAAARVWAYELRESLRCGDRVDLAGSSFAGLPEYFGILAEQIERAIRAGERPPATPRDGLAQLTEVLEGIEAGLDLEAMPGETVMRLAELAARVKLVAFATLLGDVPTRVLEQLLTFARWQAEQAELNHRIGSDLERMSALYEVLHGAGLPETPAGASAPERVGEGGAGSQGPSRSFAEGVCKEGGAA